MAEGDTLLNAVIGAVVTVVLSFLPVSPVFGGAAAAYLQGGDRSEGARVGGLSGVIAAVPLVLIVGLVGAFLFAVPIGGAPRTVVIAFAVFLLVGLVVIAAYSALLGAAGGYLLVYLVEEDVL